MARFALDCLERTDVLTSQLESELGPGTSQLTMRCGLHSGAVTAGVLRGEKSRFQLFGDTMNTASRMESTSMPGKIQVSQETADLIIAAGKGHWLTQRDGKVDGACVDSFPFVHSSQHLSVGFESFTHRICIPMDLCS